MDILKLHPEVESQINLKESLFVFNYALNIMGLENPDSVFIISMTSINDIENHKMITQEYKLNIFHAPSTNVKVTIKTYRAKCWSCSNTFHKITDTVTL